MGVFDFLRLPDKVDDLGYFDRWAAEYARNEGLNEEVNYLTGRVREIEEDLLRISDAFDNVGWSPLPEDQSNEIPLATVKKVASVARAMNAMNPFVKRGVNARISYIWGKGVKFDGIDSVTNQFANNRTKLFSPQAYEELERVLATDGNAFTALPHSDQTLSGFRIPLDEISGAVANPDDKEEIWYFKREYTVMVTNRDTGEQEPRAIIKYYPSMAYYMRLEKEGKNIPRRWNKHGVDQKYVIQHTAVNKQVGWRWGVPDILPVIFWAKAYKEYLEDNAMLVKAYSRLAWTVKVPNAQAGNVASAQVMAPPSRDPLTGELRYVGGTSVGTHEVAPVPANGSNVDFSNGSALASAIAAGLEVSKVVITSDPGDGTRATAETLDLPTLKAMESRQQLHVERFMSIFEFWGAEVDLNMSSQLVTVEISESAGKPPKKSQYASVLFPPIETDSTKDRMTALGTGVELGFIFPSEARREALESMKITPVEPWYMLPTIEDNPAKKEAQEHSDEQAEKSVIAKQGVSGGVSARGGAQTRNNEARDNRKQDSNNA